MAQKGELTALVLHEIENAGGERIGLIVCGLVVLGHTDVFAARKEASQNDGAYLRFHRRILKGLGLRFNV